MRFGADSFGSGRDRLCTVRARRFLLCWCGFLFRFRQHGVSHYRLFFALGCGFLLAFRRRAFAAAGVAAVFAGAAVFLRPKRLPRGGATASSSRHSSSVTDFGSVSFGMRALRLAVGDVRAVAPVQHLDVVDTEVLDDAIGIRFLLEPDDFERAFGSSTVYGSSAASAKRTSRRT